MALGPDSPYVCTLFNYAQGKAGAAEERMLLLCQGRAHHHWEQEKMHCRCQNTRDPTILTHPCKPTGKGTASGMAGPYTLIRLDSRYF